MSSSPQHRRKRAFALLLIVFVVIPAAEIWGIIQVGHLIGPLWTIALLVGEAFVGSWLVRHQGRRAWQALRTTLEEGRMPSNELADRMLMLLGGAFVFVPGFLTDLIGLFLILPFTRPLARALVGRVVGRRIEIVGTPGRNAPRPGHGDVVQGEVIGY